MKKSSMFFVLLAFSMLFGPCLEAQLTQTQRYMVGGKVPVSNVIIENGHVKFFVVNSMQRRPLHHPFTQIFMDVYDGTEWVQNISGRISLHLNASKAQRLSESDLATCGPIIAQIALVLNKDILSWYRYIVGQYLGNTPARFGLELVDSDSNPGTLTLLMGHQDGGIVATFKSLASRSCYFFSKLLPEYGDAFVYHNYPCIKIRR